MKKLAIAIPTFNEHFFLEKNLETLLPQLEMYKDEVDLYVFDNNSSDNTFLICNNLFKNKSNCNYKKNSENIGIFKNQLQCLKLEGYEYINVLGSDDLIIPGGVSKILNKINQNIFSIIYLNYFSFEENYQNPKSFFAPEKSVEFSRPYDLLNYPSVGHFSGFIFKADCLKRHLDKLLNKYESSFFEKHRGIIAFLSAYICSFETKNTYFIGERYLATNYSKKTDYNSLEHLCVDYLEGHYLLFKDGIANQSDYEYRKNLVKKMLLKSSLRNLPFITSKRNKDILNHLNIYFGKDIYLIFIITPIFLLMRINLIKYFSSKIVNHLINN